MFNWTVTVLLIVAILLCAISCILFIIKNRRNLLISTTNRKITSWSDNKLDLTGFSYSPLEDERLPQKFTLKKNNKVLLQKKDVHWWLAGLKFVEFSNTADLSLSIKIVFPNKKMRDAFVSGLINVGYTNHEFTKHLKSVHVRFTKPHSTQPVSRTRIQEAFIQQGNENNCNMFHEITSEYSNTVDKLEFLYRSSPELYNKFLKSFHSKELYSNFELINPILKKFNSLNRSAKIDDPFTDSFDI